MVANWDSQRLGITGDIFHVFHGLIQESPKAYPMAYPQSSTGCSLITRNKTDSMAPQTLLAPLQRKRKGFKDGGTHRGLANSRSRAAISRPSENHHTAHLGSAPQEAGPGPGCCRRQGQVGRTLSRSPPPRPAALHSRR